MKLIFGEKEIANAIACFAERLGHEVDFTSKIFMMIDANNNWTATITIKDKEK